MKTNAKVSVFIQNGKKTALTYDSSEKEFESIKIQTEATSRISPLKRLRPIGEERHTPKKLLPKKKSLPPSSTITKPPSSTITKPPVLMVENLPGAVPNKSSKTCAVCKIDWDSKEDEIFRKGKMRKTTWIGCDRPRCRYWAHASCVGLFFKPGVDVENHDFLCAKHKKR